MTTLELHQIANIYGTGFESGIPLYGTHRQEPFFGAMLSPIEKSLAEITEAYARALREEPIRDAEG